MKSSKYGSRGFTLVEVMVALAIAAGALILLLSANQASLQRSVRSRHEALLQRLCESKFDECRCGAETRKSGAFDELPGWTWRFDEEKKDLEDLEGLQRLIFKVYPPDAPFLARTTFVVYRYREPERKP